MPDFIQVPQKKCDNTLRNNIAKLTQSTPVQFVVNSMAMVKVQMKTVWFT